MLAGDAAEELEVYYILYRLREAGYEVDVAAPRKGLLRTISRTAGTPTSSARAAT